MRNLSGRGVAVVCGYCGRAPLSTGTAAVPSGLSDVLHTSGARSLMCDFARRLESSRTLRSLRHPPHRWGLVCCCDGSLDLCLAFGTKFSLLGFLVVRTVQNSPCMSKKRQIEPFRVSRESFIPEMRRGRACRESFVPHMRCEGCAGRVLYRKLGRAARAGRDLFRRGTFRVCSCRVSATHRRSILALGPCSALDTGSGGGFAPCEALWRRVAGVSHPCMAQFPPLGSGAAAVRGGAVAKVQTTSVKNTENGLLVAKWSAFWAQRCLAWCARSHVNPLLRVSTRDTARKPAIESVSGAAQARISGLTCELVGPA